MIHPQLAALFFAGLDSRPTLPLCLPDGLPSGCAEFAALPGSDNLICTRRAASACFRHHYSPAEERSHVLQFGNLLIDFREYVFEHFHLRGN
jgi:hypothetical protein